MPQQLLVWTTNADLAQAVLNAREASGLSQAELSRLARVDRKLVYRLERGSGNVRVASLMRVFAVLRLAPLIVPAEALGALR
jgi:transcriptional regulator with XRE-family HTH domain